MVPSAGRRMRLPTTRRSSSFSRPSTRTSTQACNPAAADRLGVVYTPNEVVDFIIRGSDWLLQKALREKSGRRKRADP